MAAMHDGIRQVVSLAAGADGRLLAGHRPRWVRPGDRIWPSGARDTGRMASLRHSAGLPTGTEAGKGLTCRIRAIIGYAADREFGVR
jgi:hypothetical protein